MAYREESPFSGGPERSEGDTENGGRPTRIPDPEVKATRRRFPAEYKLRILREAEACDEPGQLGALLRREGLYSSHLTAWRQQLRAGLADEKRGRKPKRDLADRRRIERLERENRRLRRRLEQTEAIIAVQKKLTGILESMSTEKSESGDESR